VGKAKNPDSLLLRTPLFLIFPFPLQSGTIVSGFARTLEVIYQLHFGVKKGVAER
jgi:hypothetical protein